MLTLKVQWIKNKKGSVSFVDLDGILRQGMDIYVVNELTERQKGNGSQLYLGFLAIARAYVLITVTVS